MTSQPYPDEIQQMLVNLARLRWSIEDLEAEEVLVAQVIAAGPPKWTSPYPRAQAVIEYRALRDRRKQLLNELHKTLGVPADADRVLSQLATLEEDEHAFLIKVGAQALLEVAYYLSGP